GALRFWLRALLGGIIGDDKLNDLRKAESAVFGSTEGASPVVVRLIGEDQAQSYRPLLHNPSKMFTFQGIKPGQLLTMTLLPRPPHRTIPEAACGALLVFLLLGGLGKRSRRGFGSFIARSISGEFPLQLPDYSDANRFAKQLPSLIQQAIEVIESFAQILKLDTGTPITPPQFAVLHNKQSKVLFCKKPFPKWEEAMEAFWKVLRSDSYRDNHVFGFTKVGRQASPLHLRIVKLGEGYHILLTAFRIRFVSQQPSWEVMQKFLEECKQKWEGEWAFGGDVQWK
ncbi:MAG: type III-B CRISPR module RAMP protein Cmr1, partial [Candidatus Thorarchaeota archaeon]